MDSAFVLRTDGRFSLRIARSAVRDSIPQRTHVDHVVEFQIARTFGNVAGERQTIAADVRGSIEASARHQRHRRPSCEPTAVDGGAASLSCVSVTQS